MERVYKIEVCRLVDGKLSVRVDGMEVYLTQPKTTHDPESVRGGGHAYTK